MEKTNSEYVYFHFIVLNLQKMWSMIFWYCKSSFRQQEKMFQPILSVSGFDMKATGCGGFLSLTNIIHTWVKVAWTVIHKKQNVLFSFDLKEMYRCAVQGCKEKVYFLVLVNYILFSEQHLFIHCSMKKYSQILCDGIVHYLFYDQAGQLFKANIYFWTSLVSSRWQCASGGPVSGRCVLRLYSTRRTRQSLLENRPWSLIRKEISIHKTWKFWGPLDSRFILEEEQHLRGGQKVRWLAVKLTFPEGCGKLSLSLVQN